MTALWRAMVAERSISVESAAALVGPWVEWGVELGLWMGSMGVDGLGRGEGFDGPLPGAAFMAGPGAAPRRRATTECPGRTGLRRW